MNCNLVKIPNPFDWHKKQISILPVVPGTRIADLVRLAGFGPAVVVIRNGKIEENFDAWILTGDIIHVFPRLQDDVIKTVATIAMVAAVSYYAPGAGAGLASMFGGSAALWSGVFTVVTLTAGGMLINSLMPPPAIQGSSTNRQIDDSPTYGWQGGVNPTEEGRAIPVIYGNELSVPQVINFYKEIIDGWEWAHWLLCVGEGLTNNVPTEDDIYIGDVLLSSFDPTDFDLYVTDGGNSPDTAQLVKFNELHQFREVQKAVVADPNSSLLHFNGTNGSTTIVEEAVFNHNWTCYGAAQLSTAHPWQGTANLDVTNSGDYIRPTGGTLETISTLDVLVVDEWDIEFRFRQSTLADAGIIGAKDDDTTHIWYWSILYDHTNTKLIYQQFRNDNTVYFNVSSSSVTLTVDTWHTIRVARSGDTVYLFFDGTLVGSGAYSVTPANPAATGTWHNYIGCAYWYLSAPSYTLTYAQAEIDEFYFKNGSLIHNTLGNYTPTTEEYELIDLGVNVGTKGIVDQITFIINASNGLYWTDYNDGSLQTLTIWFNFKYRIKGTSTWTSHSAYIRGKSRYPIKKQFNYNVTRGEYETCVVRTVGNFQGTPYMARTYWTGIDEVLDEFLSYPNLQLVSVSLKAQDEFSGALPMIQVINNRTSIEVPNFNGSGTMIVDPTNNAYADYDMLTNDLYGGGVDSMRFDEDAWQDWIDWCDGLVDGNKRCQFNMIMDANYDMDTALQHAENAGRAKIVMRGTQISVVIEKPESVSFPFSSGNLKAGAKITWLPRSDRSDALEISYRNKDKLWQDDKVFHPGTGYETLSRVPKIVRINLPGINNEEQAMREAILRQQISENIKRSITLESGIEAIVCTTGDVIRFAHEGNSMVAGGRLAADSAGGSIRIDKIIELDSATFSGNCKIWIKTADDTILEGTISGPFDEETDTFFTSISSAVERFDNYIVGRSTGEKYLYRLVSAKRSSNQEVAFTGLQYVESSYYHEDYGSGAIAI